MRVLWDHWNRVEEQDRRRAASIIGASRGLQHKMSGKERNELVDIARRVDPLALGRDLADAASPFRVPGLRTKKPAKR